MRLMATEIGRAPVERMRQSIDQFEEAFERESAIEQKRRRDLQKRAANRSKARRIVKTEQRGRVRFSVLVVALTATAVTVVVVMFETLAWIVGG
jgi:ferric-dicitrate binding protein FerR (iron transport regulator)